MIHINSFPYIGVDNTNSDWPPGLKPLKMPTFCLKKRDKMILNGSKNDLNGFHPGYGGC